MPQRRTMVAIKACLMR